MLKILFFCIANDTKKWKKNPQITYLLEHNHMYFKRERSIMHNLLGTRKVMLCMSSVK